jgi:hypothetical protein
VVELPSNSHSIGSLSGSNFLNSKVLWSGEPLTSSLVKGTMTLRGPVKYMKDHMQLVHLNDKYGLEQHYPAPCRPYFGQTRTKGPPIKLKRHQECPLTIQHGTSSIKLDHRIPSDTKIYGLPIFKHWSKEHILLITPSGEGENHCKHLGIMVHTHKSMANLIAKCLAGPRIIGYWVIIVEKCATRQLCGTKFSIVFRMLKCAQYTSCSHLQTWIRSSDALLKLII